MYRYQVHILQNPEFLFSKLMKLIVKLGQYGLIHCDFNEFNIILNSRDQPRLIDFPQMVSTSHSDAQK